MRDHAADDHAGGQTHVACPAHSAAEQVQHANGHRTAERHVCVGERRRQHFAMPAHPAKDDWCAEQQHRRECRRKAKGENKSMKGERVGYITLASAEARAIAEETPPPMPLAAVCWISITNGKASDTPASASGPRRPTNSPSNVIMPAIASRFSAFGAASRSNVVEIGPSSSNLVRAPAGRTAPALVVTVDENARLEIATPRSLMGASPRAGLEQRLRRKRPERPGGCVKSPI